MVTASKDKPKISKISRIESSISKPLASNADGYISLNLFEGLLSEVMIKISPSVWQYPDCDPVYHFGI